MRILPLCYHPNLSDDEMYRHECSDRIWVPRQTFERWMTAEDVGNVVIVKLEQIAACMYAPHAGARNLIYAPMWMCEALGVSTDPDDQEDDFIVPERLQPPMCTFVRVQPHTSDHLPPCVGGASQGMPEDTLSRAFEEYTCLVEGQTMSLLLPNGSRMFVTIVETQPQKGPLCIRNTEIAMDLLTPLDFPEPTPEPQPVPEPAQPEPVPEPTPAPQQPTETREERRERLAKAALARMNMS